MLFLEMNDDCITIILTYLTLSSILNLSGTCRRLNVLCHEHEKRKSKQSYRIELVSYPLEVSLLDEILPISWYCSLFNAVYREIKFWH